MIVRFLDDKFDEARVLAIRDRCYAQRKRHFANYVVKVLRLMMEWGRPRKWIKVNGVRGVPLTRKPKGAPRANRAWTDEEFATVMAEASLSLRVAIALAAYAGLREGNVIRFSKSGYNGQAIEARQEKTDEPIYGYPPTGTCGPSWTHLGLGPSRNPGPRPPY
jgi:hypothetical protein